MQSETSSDVVSLPSHTPTTPTTPTATPTTPQYPSTSLESFLVQHDHQFSNIIDEDDDDEYDLGGEYDDDNHFNDLDGMIDAIEDSIVQDAISKNVDLREYDENIARELRSIEIDSIDEYLKEGEQLANLHQQLSSFDSIMEKMENMLVDFHNSLGNISDDIKNLQHSSYTMNVQLRNRTCSEKLIGEFVQKVVIPPALIIQICDAPIDEKYVSYIIFLSQQLKTLDSIPKHYPSYLELEPVLRDLTSTAVFRVKQSLLEKIRAITQKNSKKNINNQLFIQQKLMLKFKPLYDFLEQCSPKCALEVRREYNNVMSHHYSSSFSNYTRALMKKYPSAFVRGNYNISTIVENNIFDISSIFASDASTSKDPAQFFCLKDRYFKCAGNTMIPLATAHNTTRDFEELWTSIGMLLINTASSEFVFCIEFFNSIEVCNQLFSSIFGATLRHLYTFLESWISNSLDGVAILIILRKVKEFQQIMQKREIREQSLSVFWGRVKKLCLDRFQTIFEANLDSLNTLMKPNALTSAVIHRECKSYTISRKYAHFSASVHRLGFGTRMEQQLKRLAKLMESVLMEMSKLSKTGQIDHVLIINCVDQILKVFINSEIRSSLVRDWGEVLVSNAASYIEQLLRQPYMQMHRILAFLNACETRVMKGEDDKTREGNKRTLEMEITIDSETRTAFQFMSILTDEFQQTWIKQLNDLYNQIASEFPNRLTGQEIFQKCVLQFVLYYIRFGKIVSYCQSDDISNNIVPQTKIQHELSVLFERFVKSTEQQEQSTSPSQQQQ